MIVLPKSLLTDKAFWYRIFRKWDELDLLRSELIKNFARQ